MSPHGNDLQQQVREPWQVVNKLLTKQEQPLRPRHGLCRFESGYLPGNYSGCFTSGMIAQEEGNHSQETAPSWALELEPCYPLHCKAPNPLASNRDSSQHQGWLPG